MELEIFCDGGSRKNPGPAASAFIVIFNKKVIYRGSLFLGRKTNNEAEYLAVILALKWLINFVDKKSFGKIQFFLDSELVVRQLKGEYKIKSKNLLGLVSEIKKLEKETSLDILFTFIPRNKNFLADALVNKTLDENVQSFTFVKLFRAKEYFFEEDPHVKSSTLIKFKDYAFKISKI